MPAHVITVAQQKGGACKTTLAIHLAVAFAQKGLSTMLFDTDPQGTASHWHAQRKKDDIGLIATSGWRLTRDLAMARESNDVIIIDTPPHAEMDIKVSTRAADLVLVPMQPSPADLWAVRETINTVSSDENPALVVLNRVIHRANITTEMKEKLGAMGIAVAEAEIGNRVLFPASMEMGLTVLDGFQNPAQQEIMSLVNEISAYLGIQTQATKKTSKKTKAVAKPAAASAAKADAPAAQKAAPINAAAPKAAAKKTTAKVKQTAAAKASKKVAAKPAAKKAKAS